MDQESQVELPSLCLKEQSGVPIKDANLRIQCGIRIEVTIFVANTTFATLKNVMFRAN